MAVSQLLYSIAAVSLLAIVSFQMSLGVSLSTRAIHENEILTQVSGISNEILEDIGSHPFDNRTREDLFEDPPAGADELTLPENFGGVSKADCHTSCMDVDDFHGLTFDRTRAGLDYEIGVQVRYVDPIDPRVVSATPTFAKEVVLEITSEHVRRNANRDSLVTVEISRVFSYLKTTI